MRFLVAAFVFVLIPGTFASCQSAPPAHAAPAPSDEAMPFPEPEDAEGGAEVDRDGETAAAPEGKLENLEVVEDEGEHCPPEMVYVEGEYCTSLDNHAVPDEHGNTPGAGAKDLDVVVRECKREWYAEQNKKRVCEEFADTVTCAGKKVKKRFCIDRYEWPNVKGHKPEVMNRFYQAEVKCATAGKRLCTESEWTFACEGEKMSPFPYGNVRDATKCHGDEEWDAPNMKKVAARDPKELRRLYKGKPSGQPECVSEFGVYDLPANADEVVASETFGSGSRSKFESITTGGPWYKGVRNQCRPKIYTHDEGFYYYYLSFRCCAEADGAPTDPRTPKQRAEGKTMKWVEAQAGFTVEEMRALYEKAKTDPTCGCTTTRCRTMCGTLHGDPGTGPDAWNPPLLEQVGNGMD